MNKDTHILVTGSNRSGTTWVGEMLRLCGEKKYIYEPFSRNIPTVRVDCPLKYHFHYVVPEESDQVKEYMDSCLSFNNRSWRKDFFFSPSIRQFFGASWRYAKEIALNLTCSGYIIKDPLALFSAPWIYQNYPCQVVVVIRHPAAYVNSIKRMSWRVDPKDYLNQSSLMKNYLHPLEEEIKNFVPSEENIVAEATLRWKIYHLVIENYRKSYPRWIFVRHEDLSSDPVNGFKQLYNKLGLHFSKKVEAQIIESASGPKDVYLGNKTHVLKRDSKGNIKKWKTDLTLEEINYIQRETHNISDFFYINSEW